MRQYIFIILLFYSAIEAASAQSALPQSETDSLWAVWSDPAQDDTSRLEAMDYLAYNGYLYSRPDTAFYYAQLQYDLAKSKGLKKYMADALVTQGISLDVKGEYPQALDYYQHSSDIYKEIGDQGGMASILGNMAIVYANQGNYLEALNYFQSSLKVYQVIPQADGQIGDKNAITTVLNNIGGIYGSLSNYPLALESFQQSLKIAEEVGDKKSTAFALDNIGNLYQHQDENLKALANFQRCIQIYDEFGDNWNVARSLSNIGLVYTNQEDYPKALDYFQRSLEMYEELSDQSGIASALHFIGVNYKYQGNDTQALDYFQRSLKIHEEIGAKQGVADLLNEIGILYNQQKNYEKAIDWCERGLKLSGEIGAIQDNKSSCKCLYEAHKSLGNDGKALGYYEQMIVLKDSIYNEDNTKKLTRLEMQFDFDKKEAAAQAEQEKKDAIAAQELKRQKLVRNGFMGGFAVVLLFAGIVFTQRNKIKAGKKQSDALLLNILPEEVAEELKEKGHSDAQLIDQVTVLFTDFKGFTALSEKLTPKNLVNDLHECFSAFDRICEKYGIEKIKTIGDAYMAASGLPSPSNSHAQNMVKAALEMAAFVTEVKSSKQAAGLPFFEVRIGVHSGPVVAGIVGIKKFQYDIWGDTVNTASRMESSGSVGQVNISQTTYELLKDKPEFTFESRGKIEAKGKGEIEMYFVSKA